MDKLKSGDTLKCTECNLEIQITKPCDCDDCSHQFTCCGKPLVPAK